MSRLVIRQPGKPARTFSLPMRKVIVGRGKTAQLMLLDISVSRQHAQLEFNGRAHTITDISSQNKVLVNGEEIQTQLLHDGDHIQIGKFLLIYEQEGSHWAEEDNPDSMDEYEVTGRASFIERISAEEGPKASGTSYLDPQQIQAARRQALLLELGRLELANGEQAWHPGKQTLAFGKGGIPTRGGLGLGGAASLGWDGKSHVITKKGMMLTLKVNGQSVSKASLKDGDKIELAKTHFVYRCS